MEKIVKKECNLTSLFDALMNSFAIKSAKLIDLSFSLPQ